MYFNRKQKSIKKILWKKGEKEERLSYKSPTKTNKQKGVEGGRRMSK